MRLAPDGPVRTVGNRMCIDPEHIFPKPRSQGRPAALTLEPGFLVLDYATEEPIGPPPLVENEQSAYLFCLGHALLVGKMYMQDAVFQVVPRNPDAAHLDFSLHDYRKQLAAGESTMKAHGELVVRLPNLEEYCDLREPAVESGAEPGGESFDEARGSRIDLRAEPRTERRADPRSDGRADGRH